MERCYRTSNARRVVDRTKRVVQQPWVTPDTLLHHPARGGVGISPRRTEPVNLWTRIQDLLERVAHYSPLDVFIEMVVIWAILFGIVRFVRGTRAAGALRGMFVLLLGLVLAAVLLRTFGAERFLRLTFLSDRFLAIVAIALVVVFQPELRRGLIRLGEAGFFRLRTGEIAQTVDAVVEASAYLSKARFGALIVLERQVGLAGLTEGGTTLKAEVSARLLQTIFYPGTALHDLAVVIRGTVIHSAGVQLPLAEAEEMPDPSFGSRHRAAVGLASECDALVVIVSEETGAIRLCERGALGRPLTPDQLRSKLRDRLERVPAEQGQTAQEQAEQDESSVGEAETPAA